MPVFHVYVEFYGKKLKIEIEAANEFRADIEVRSRLRILEIKEKEIIIPDRNEDQQMFSSLKDIFGMK